MNGLQTDLYLIRREEEYKKLRQQLAECERESGEINDALGVLDNCMIAPLVKSLNDQLSTVTAERDELVAALRHILNAPQDPDAVDQAFAALAKLGADKTGDGS